MTTNFVENTSEDNGLGEALSPNPFGITDYSNNQTRSNLDRYWSETKAPKVSLTLPVKTTLGKKDPVRLESVENDLVLALSGKTGKFVVRSSHRR